MDPARAALPALTRDPRPAALVGRHAALELVFEPRGGRTVLSHAYAEPPYHIGAGYAVGRGVALTIVCAGAGIFPGDGWRQSVRVASGAQVVLSSQSALQARGGAAAAATLRQEYDVEPDGELHCLWDPLIPFAGARLSQEIDIRLCGGARLFWSDALMSGRVARSESWMFASLSHELRLTIGETLIYLERYALDHGGARALQPWSAGPSPFLGTALVSHPEVTLAGVDRLQDDLGAIAGVHAGVDLPDTRLAVARIAGRSGATFKAARALIRRWATSTLFRDAGLEIRR
ncbi:MAG TPA: urease accessory protein UreD [Vicinamibacterales bacterium]|nr:urease accessory protein UreD [Vicinamibacterales bacterium]